MTTCVKPRHRLSARRTAAAVAVALVASTASAGAASGDSPLMLEGPNVIDYENTVIDGQHVWEPVALQNGVRSIVQGVPRPDGGCDLPMAGVGTVGSTGAVVELAFDPDTCRSLILTGTASANFLGGHGGGGEESGVVSESGSAAPVSGGFGIMSTGRYYARMTSQYDEPARWVFNDDADEDGLLPPVTRATNWVEWTPQAGGCATAPGTTSYMGYKLEWYTTSGWQLDSHTHLTQPTGCYNGVKSESYVQYSNNEFCAALGAVGLSGSLLGGLLYPLIDPFIADTRTYFWPNQVIGWNNSTYSYGSVPSKSGGCDFFLQFKFARDSRDA